MFALWLWPDFSFPLHNHKLKCDFKRKHFLGKLLCSFIFYLLWVIIFKTYETWLMLSLRRSNFFSRPSPVLTSDGEKQWEECNDLINNKGCIKQVVNDGEIETFDFWSDRQNVSFYFIVVLLRACWMQGNNQCLVDGTATVCTCKEDLCNSSKGCVKLF